MENLVNSHHHALPGFTSEHSYTLNKNFRLAYLESHRLLETTILVVIVKGKPKISQCVSLNVFYTAII